jgi:hypothetical protein
MQFPSGDMRIPACARALTTLWQKPFPIATGPGVRQWVLAGLLAAMALVSAGAGEPALPPSAKDSTREANPARPSSRFQGILEHLLPTSLQKRPKVFFNVFTEMTDEGRKWRVPTPEKPLTYFSSPGEFVQKGWMVAAGEKPPPKQELHDAMQKALAGNGYVPIANDQTRPDLLVVFTYGSHGTDPTLVAPDSEAAISAITAQELFQFMAQDPSLYRDILDRAEFVGGGKFARALQGAFAEEFANMQTNRTLSRLPPPQILLPVAPESFSPLDIFMRSGNGDAMRRLTELAFHTCYFVVATAYDFRGVENRQRVPLWRTRMTVEAQGVSLEEILRPLIQATGSYLGRETPEAVQVTRQLDREGRVDLGTPTVVEEPRPSALPPAERP